MNAPRLELRAAACELAALLVRAGYEAFFAGGCVRDHLLHITPRDYDIATNATPEQLRVLFPKARGVGEVFGVMLVRHAGHVIEVSTFREDGDYQDGRRPVAVRFVDAASDAHRRDFTINGIFQRPDTGEIVDFVEGRADLNAKIVRAIGDPHARIREDRLRMLRAPRFAARFNFTLHPLTAEAIRAHASELLSVSAERVGDEFRRMMSDPSRLTAARMVEDLGLDHAVFAQRVAEHAWTRLAALPTDASSSTALAAWWLDRLAATDTDLPRPTLIEQRTAVDTMRRNLTLSNDDAAALTSLLAAREALLDDFTQLTLAQRVRVSSRPGFDEALTVLAGECPDRCSLLRAQIDRENPLRALPEPLLNGSMLLAEGMQASPIFKVILDETLNAQIEGQIDSAAAALQFARQIVSTSGARDGRQSRGSTDRTP